MIVSFVVVIAIRAVIAGAGVFEVVAGGAILEVEVEANGLCFGIRSALDLENHGDVHSFWEGFVRKQNAILDGKFHAGRRTALSADEGDLLLRRCDFLSFFAEEGDLNFAIFGDEKFGMWLDFGEDATAVWSCFFGSAVVAVLMAFVVMPFMIRVFFGMVMSFMVVFFGSEERS